MHAHDEAGGTVKLSSDSRPRGTDNRIEEEIGDTQQRSKAPRGNPSGETF